MEPVIDVGSAAPDFTLKDQNEQEVTLSALRGKKVILSFHPLAWTRVCAIQMQDLEKHREEIERLGAVALGLITNRVVVGSELPDQFPVNNSAQAIVTVIEPGSLANPTPIALLDSGPAAPYPSVIRVSGLAGQVTKVTATLVGLPPTYFWKLPISSRRPPTCAP